MKINTIRYAGHSAIFLDGTDFTLAIDPWLTTNPLCPEELKQPDSLDVIVLTHGHSDHASDAAHLAKQYGSKVCATFELANLLAQDGVPENQLVFMNKGGSVSLDGVDVILTHAEHSNSYDSKEGPKYAGEACGAIIRTHDHTFYHLGDTGLFSDLKLIGECYKPDTIFIPIGDRFTMGPELASKATELINPKTAIPIHFGTFPLLTGTPDQFAKCAEHLNTKIIPLEPGASLSLTY